MTDTNRKFIAAAAKPGGSLSILTGDGDESVEEIEKAMLDLGVQPESVAAFVERTALTTAKHRVREGALLEACDVLRKATWAAGYGDDVFVGLVLGEREFINFAGRTTCGPLVTKAAPLRHAATGKFTDKVTSVHDGVTWTHTNSHPVLMQTAGKKFTGGKLAPGNTNNIPVSPYDGEPGDGNGRRTA